MWEYETEDGKHDMFMDIEEEIRFRVVEETFVDTSPISGTATTMVQACMHHYNIVLYTAGITEMVNRFGITVNYFPSSISTLLHAVQPSAKPADTVASPGVATTSTPSHQAPYTITVREAPTNTHIMIVSF